MTSLGSSSREEPLHFTAGIITVNANEETMNDKSNNFLGRNMMTFLTLDSKLNEKERERERFKRHQNFLQRKRLKVTVSVIDFCHQKNALSRFRCFFRDFPPIYLNLIALYLLIHFLDSCLLELFCPLNVSCMR